MRETGNVSQVCREFNISRPTLYKWLKRSDPEKPSTPLRSRSRRPKSRGPRKWGERELFILADLDSQTVGRLSAAKLSKALPPQHIYLSSSTVGRMMLIIARKCPICRKVERIHDMRSHLFSRDMIERAARQEIVLATSELEIPEPSLWKGGSDHGHPVDERVGCQASVKGGHRQCKNHAIISSPFCAVHNGYGGQLGHSTHHRVNQEALKLRAN